MWASRFYSIVIAPATLDEILVTAPGTWGAAAVRFIVARKDVCESHCDVQLSRRGILISDKAPLPPNYKTPEDL
jgi:hypothetical protein